MHLAILYIPWGIQFQRGEKVGLLLTQDGKFITTAPKIEVTDLTIEQMYKEFSSCRITSASTSERPGTARQAGLVG